MKLLLYCTKAKPYLLDLRNDFQNIKFDTFNTKESLKTGWNVLNGTIVGECDYEVEEIELKMEYMGLYYCGKTVYGWDGSLCEESQLDNWQLLDYLGDKIGNKGYAIHIKKLKIFDKLYKLNDCVKPYNKWFHINKAPQNMQKVWFSEDNEEAYEDYILISIRPEWLCKILNGEKTIEVRKKVLKEMLLENDNERNKNDNN